MADHSRSCPYDSANIFSKITFWWMNALFTLGSKNHLTSLNICDVSKDDESGLVQSKLECYWKEEVQKYSEGQKASLFRAVLLAFKWQWIIPGFFVICLESIRLVQPYLIGLLVSCFNDETDAVPLETAYGIGVCLGVSAILQISLNSTYFFIMQHVAMRMKVAVGALIYRKVLTLKSDAFQHTSAAQVVHLLSTDIEKFNSSIDLVHYIWASPVSICIVIYLIYQQVGAVCFGGLAVIIVIVSLHAGLSIIFGKLRHMIDISSARRVQLMSEIFMSMKMIKVLCWEQPFKSLISKMRRYEIFLLRWCGFIQSIGSVTEAMTSRLALFVIVLLLWQKGSTGSAEVFTTLVWLCVLQSLVLRFPVQALLEVRKLHSSAQLVQAFLLLDEEKEQIKDLRLHRSISYHNEPRSDWAIDIDHMTARWPLIHTERRKRFHKKKQRSSTSSTKSLLHESDVDHAFSLKYISLQIKKGELLAVTGVVGSGKSSLLLCLIGELPYEIGQISINGRVSYCGQTNWVFSGTVKDNILFGHPFNRNHYQHVIQACGLTQDLELLPKGDLTFVGERGLPLSRGQKARLSLARCVYHDADVFLLNDPLSFVDASMGRHIFQCCIMGLLKERTVVLVSSDLQYLKQVDRIVVLRDGSIYDVGTYHELKSRGVDMRVLVASDEQPKHISEAAREAEEEETKLFLESKCYDVTMENNTEEDEQQTVTVGFSVYWAYFCAGFGPALMPILLPLLVAGPALYCLSDWMLADWLSIQRDKRTSNATNLNSLVRTTTDSLSSTAPMMLSLKMYIISLTVCCAIFLLFSIAFLQMAAKAGKRLHDRMMDCVLNTVLYFFETHSVGALLKRFSKDVDSVDNNVSLLSYTVSMRTTQYFGFLLVTVIANPWMTIALVPVLVLIVLISWYAQRTLRQIKRLEIKARNPVYSHMSDTILGLETIRALGKRDQFLTEFDEHQNNHTAAWFLFLSSYRWMSVRSLAAVVLYLNVIIFVALSLKESLNGNLMALSLIYCISISESFEFYLRAVADLDIDMTSVAQVLDYCQLEQEPPKVSEKPPSPDWPNRGAITFTNMSFQSSRDPAQKHRDLECHIQGKEKIGIVGRVGSRKSSIITSLFQLARQANVIYIDGVDIGKLGLHELRTKISLIPQDPILFTQNLRWNLDPLNEFSDERLWNALEQVKLKNKVDHMPGKLYSELQEWDTDLSVGQRQLIYLARAILKDSRILIIDEATVTMDQETDDIIQRTVRAKFRESTVLTIAHRFYTVMDCDRIMVLEDGRLKEFDTPFNLLQNPDGIFTKMVLSRGKSQAKQLQALAELSQHQRTSASLHLQRAMLLANEQLAQSTEDLRAGRRALSWNRFSHSQDSLDKVNLTVFV